MPKTLNDTRMKAAIQRAGLKCMVFLYNPRLRKLIVRALKGLLLLQGVPSLTPEMASANMANPIKVGTAMVM
jgi:hypothetical protein